MSAAHARLGDGRAAHYREPQRRCQALYPLNVFVLWQPSGVRRFLSHVDRPIDAAQASVCRREEIRRVMGQSGVDFAGPLAGEG